MSSKEYEPCNNACMYVPIFCSLQVVFGVATEDVPATQKTANQTANSQGAVNGQQPVSAGVDSTMSSVADTSTAVSTAVSESQSHQEQPQAKVGPPKPR